MKTAWGGQLNKPVYSYRMDLTAVGYAVARQSWPENIERPLFRSICLSNRERVDSFDSFEDIIRGRDIEMKKAHPSICAYLKRLDELVSWSGPPPSNNVYDALMDIFP